MTLSVEVDKNLAQCFSDAHNSGLIKIRDPLAPFLNSLKMSNVCGTDELGDCIKLF
jgi:hypothetical protein